MSAYVQRWEGDRRRNCGDPHHLIHAKRQHEKGSKPRGQPSLIATIIDTDSTPTWTTCETHSPNLKQISSIDWEGANAKRTGQDLVIVTRASAHRVRSHYQNLMSRRAADPKRKEADPTSTAKTSEGALQQMRTDRTGSLLRHPQPNWSSGR